MLNCPGLRMHRGIRPFWPLKLAIKLVSIDPLKPIMHPLTGFFYNKIGLRVPNGEVAATALLNLRTFAFEKQKPLAEYVSKHPTVNKFLPKIIRLFRLELCMASVEMISLLSERIRRSLLYVLTEESM